MKLLEERIQKDGKIRNGGAVLKVDSFLNHQIDVKLYNEIGKEFFRLFGDEKVTKILTIEASGIGIACIAGQYFDVPVIFAKKSKSKNIDGSVYFLANGSALNGLIQVVKSAGATLVGAGICVEKAFQPGGDLIRGQGIRVESLARIESMSETEGVTFC